MMMRVRALARAARHLPDRLLHRRRHARSQVLLRRRPPTRVLFVCLGNICRSPYAEAALRAKLNGRGVCVKSAGFIGPGRPMPEAARRVAARRGVDVSTHSSQLVTAELVGSMDLIVVMDPRQRRGILKRFGRELPVLVLGDLDPEPIDTRAVRDPYNQPDRVFVDVFARIDRCLGVLERHLPGRTGA